MSALTTRLGLVKPGGGSTGLITPADIADIDVLNGNFDTLDGAVGALSVTSTTRPAVPFNGQLIYETDTKALVRYNGTTWLYLSGATVYTNATPLSTSTGIPAGGTLGVTSGVTLGAVPYPRKIVIQAAGTVTAQAGSQCDFNIRKTIGTGTAAQVGFTSRVIGLGTGNPQWQETIPANTTVAYQMVATQGGGGAATVTNNNDFTGMTVAATPTT